MNNVDKLQALEKSIIFWENKLFNVCLLVEKYEQLIYSYKFTRIIPLKKITGCKLSTVGNLPKVHKLRKLKINSFRCLKTKNSFYQRESLRLRRTKIPFYQEKIKELKKTYNEIQDVIITKLACI